MQSKQKVIRIATKAKDPEQTIAKLHSTELDPITPIKTRTLQTKSSKKKKKDNRDQSTSIKTLDLKHQKPVGDTLILDKYLENELDELT